MWQYIGRRRRLIVMHNVYTRPSAVWPSVFTFQSRRPCSCVGGWAKDALGIVPANFLLLLPLRLLLEYYYRASLYRTIKPWSARHGQRYSWMCKMYLSGIMSAFMLINNDRIYFLHTLFGAKRSWSLLCKFNCNWFGRIASSLSDHHLAPTHPILASHTADE